MKTLFFLLVLYISFPIIANSQNKDWIELQGKIDAARTSATGIVTIERNYMIDRPLVVYNWTGKEYGQVSISIQGYATMWDVGNRSVIKATFKDAPILSIQKGKGVIIKGINFQGAGSDGRDSRYSPFAAICIDPFSGNLPPDGGYPSLRSWYRGSQTRSGSTGIRIEDCTFNGVTVGVITSPNGYTQNAEIITLENIRTYAVKYVLVGCQSQEKMNRVINLGSWGPTKCVFVFNRYGAQQPGNWYIDGVNIAGSVDSIIYRVSAGWGGMTMDHVFAEQITSVGFWYGGSGDVFSKSLINLKYPEELGYFPENSFDARGLAIRDVNMRYYGKSETPMLVIQPAILEGGQAYVPVIKGRYGWDTTGNYRIKQTFLQSKEIVKNNKAVVFLKKGAQVKAGDHVVFMQKGDLAFAGQAQVDRIANDSVFLKYISPSIKSLEGINMGIYTR